ncbi:MAG TPA: cytochrome c oxidase assembly protein [Sandaracinaceae bacterium LLY-WYZ-13_1]|nr:cytochrome c oxidase assembly protein [Sandaracinaceae bacterium LLY-WYZ-13_1]
MTRWRARVAGLAVLLVAWGLVLPSELAPFSAHMTAHMAVVAIAAPLLAIGLRGTPIDLGARVRLSAIAASMLEGVVVWAWHAPALHRAAAEHALVAVAEQATFLAAGLALWMSALGGATQRERAPASVVALLTTSMHMTLLGALLALTSRRLFAHGAGCDPWLHPVHDQQLGGAIMIVLGGGAYLTGGLWITARVLFRAPAGDGPR